MDGSGFPFYYGVANIVAAAHGYSRCFALSSPQCSILLKIEELRTMMCCRMSKMLSRLAIAFFAGFLCLSGFAAVAQTEAGPSTAETTFKANCVMCHGVDGAGSVFGKRLNVPDLRSKEVQSMPSDALAKIIATGKNNMPAFGTRLDNAQIQNLIKYIRHLRAAPDNAK
jgi:cytochrome c6